MSAGMLEVIAEGSSRLGSAGALRPGLRLLVVGARLDEQPEWTRALIAAGARVQIPGEASAGEPAPGAADWREVDLVVAASPAAVDAVVCAPDRPGMIVVCDVLPARDVSRLLRAGAVDVLVRPVAGAELIEACGHAAQRLGSRPLRRARPPSRLPVAGATGAALARTRLPVLITGETGTGKSRMARMLHETLTPGAPFVEINAAGLGASLLTSELFGHERGAFTGAHAAKPGLVALAHGGTLFLDEIGELAADAQAQLLSFLDTGTFRPVGGVRETRSDARVVCATNRDLAAMVQAGAFRDDLYYRLASIVVPLPPVRAHPERIPGLVRDLAAQVAASARLVPPTFEPEALAALSAHDWPGNVRQLRFVVEHLVALADDERVSADLVAAVLPAAVPPGASGSTSPCAPVRPLAEVERDLVAQAMRETGGNRTRAAELLGITPRGLYNKLRRGGSSFRPQE